MLESVLKTETTQEVYNLINDCHGFELELNSLSNHLGPPLIKRLNKWFVFFNENHASCVCFYSQTIFALIKASKNNQLFRTQTTCEFELSLAFYQKLFDANIFIQTVEIEEALKLLSISLIFGKYPGMVLGSFNKSLNVLKAGFTRHNLAMLFDILFVKYELPSIFMNHIDILAETEIDAFMSVLQGNNIRKSPHLPIPISKKESYFLINQLPCKLRFKDKVLERAIISAKLLLTKPDEKQRLILFLSNSRVFRTNTLLFYQDFDFWCSAFNIICKLYSNRDGICISIIDTVDYFEYKKYTDSPNYSLKGRTLNSIVNAIIRWHELGQYSNKKELMALKWQGTGSLDYKIKYKNDKYLFKEITTGKELYTETKALKHCVFSYIKECEQGQTSIWSLKKKKSSTYKPHITIEVRDKSVVQIAGNRNRTVNAAEFELIKTWAYSKQYEIGGMCYLE